MIRPSSREDSGFWRTAPLALVAIGLYLLLHPYDGIIHDARLYVLSALNHLHPDLYGNDVFLKFGSQDSYTVFTPLFARLISQLGAEPAASLVAFASSLGVLVSGWLLVRTLANAALAWLGVALLVALPGYYGSGNTFSVLESFATPRMPAEALVLFALAAWFSNRRLLSASLLGGGFVLHPIMTFPAIVLLIVTEWGLRNVRQLAALVVIGGLLAGLAYVGWLPVSRWQFDDEWWRMIENTTNLVPSIWTTHDWARVVTVLVTLGIAGMVVQGSGQWLARGLFVTTTLLLLLGCVGGDALRIILVVQGQAWRVLWLATAVAILFLPWIAQACWQGTPIQRAGFLLLACAWLLGHQDIASVFSLTAVLVTACGRKNPLQRHARVATLSAVVLIGVVALAVLSITWTSADAEAGLTSGRWLDLATIACSSTVIPVFAIAAVWALGRRICSPLTGSVAAIALAVPVASLGATTGTTWFTQMYPQQAKAAFSAWRDLIPPGADVLWATRLMKSSDPATVWLLLERPSFYSSVQANTGLFSRAAAMELDRRARSIPPALPTELPFNLNFMGKDNPPPQCARIPAPFIITDVELPDAVRVPAPPGAGEPFSGLQLWVCPSRSAGNVTNLSSR
jgi:hypothetical protein